jgi:hypothetical protein
LWKIHAFACRCGPPAGPAVWIALISLAKPLKGRIQLLFPVQSKIPDLLHARWL